MEQQDLRMLRSAQGADVDRMFLRMTRPHHVQAVAEATGEIDHGRDGFAPVRHARPRATRAVRSGR
jgi:uncharacterized protein (DUF305 family)